MDSNDKSFCTQGNQKNGQKISVFAIRFYAWSAYVFSEDSFHEYLGCKRNGFTVKERWNSC